MRIEIVKESVVFQKTDAIVNAANATMLGGGAVDGAIQLAAKDAEIEAMKAQIEELKRIISSGK